MASPQKENGYTAIANEIMEALSAYRIPGEQMQCLLFIIRKTYGFNKKWDAISNSQFVKATGLKKSNVCRALNELTRKNIVIKKDNPTAILYYFNKKYDTWRQLSKKITTKIVIKKDNRSLSKKSTTKETIQKKNYCENSFSFKLSSLLFNLILQNNPNAKQPNIQIWAKHIDLMFRVDKRDSIKIEEIIRWCQQDDFWHTNILSTSKLRKQYDQLVIKMRASKKKKKESSHYNFPECGSCGVRASSVKKNKKCPYCDEIV